MSREAVAISAALQPAREVLEHAHQFWHDCLEKYHDPDEFQRHIEALVQNLRNVTWRIQAEKAALPPDFDVWYGEWQGYMRADPILRWLNDARIDVVKKSGLAASSKAMVRIIDSYLEPNSVLLELPARVATSDVVKRARKLVPEQYRPHVALEVLRRWESPGLEGAEILGATAHSFHVLDSLLQWIAELGDGGDPEAPPDFVSTVQFPSCMGIDPSLIPATFEADTGAPYELVMEPQALSVSPEQAAARYRVDRAGPDVVGSEEEYGEWVHGVSRRVMKKDGRVFPILLLRRPDGEWEQYLMWAEDKRDKFMQWHRMGLLTLIHGYTTYIFTTESWMVPEGDPSELRPYMEISLDPKRLESVVTYAETSDGDLTVWASQIVRRLGLVFLKPASRLENAEPGFALPVRRAWSLRGQESMHGKRRATGVEDAGHA